MLDLFRTSLHRVLTTSRGDGFAPIRLPKDFARRVNAVLGEPICSAEELDRRRAGRAKLERLRGAGVGAPAPSAPRATAPVMVYFERERNGRLLKRIEETLSAKAIPFRPLDVTGDETTLDYVMREAKCKADDLPIVFVAGSVVGGYNELVEWDVSGKLDRAVYGS